MIRINMNELSKVLRLIESFEKAETSRRDFARRHRLHPSALSRILRVGKLPEELLRELASFERLSRTHLEVIATAPEERRSELLRAAREGTSTYRLRERRETTAVPLEHEPEPEHEQEHALEDENGRTRELARSLGASPEETRELALELLSVLMRTSCDRVKASLEAYRASSARRDPRGRREPAHP